jgi:hypothetical protein
VATRTDKKAKDKKPSFICPACDKMHSGMTRGDFQRHLKKLNCSKADVRAAVKQYYDGATA